MARPRHPPLLLTPGPLTTSAATKRAMLRDWGSRDRDFIALTRQARDGVLRVAGAGDAHTAVLLQGAGTYAVEAMLGTFVPPDGKLLVLVNGAYGRRMIDIAGRLGRAATALTTPEDTPPVAAAVARALAEDRAISHVAVVHCETTTGILNPLAAIADVVAAAGRRLLVDAMSSFGAIAIDAARLPCDAIAASANKCLEGVPGVAIAIARTDALRATAGNAPSVSLDLHDQWQALEATGQWRFTPPTHVVAALVQALAEHAAEGGTAGRGARYERNCRVLVDGMRALGFTTLLPDALQAPIIVTFHEPADPAFAFPAFYDAMAARGFVIYPGKLTQAATFRIGCIGQVHEPDMHDAVAAVADSLTELGVTDGVPAPG